MLLQSCPLTTGLQRRATSVTFLLSACLQNPVCFHPVVRGYFLKYKDACVPPCIIHFIYLSLLFRFHLTQHCARASSSPDIQVSISDPRMYDSLPAQSSTFLKVRNIFFTLFLTQGQPYASFPLVIFPSFSWLPLLQVLQHQHLPEHLSGIFKKTTCLLRLLCSASIPSAQPLSYTKQHLSYVV